MDKNCNMPNVGQVVACIKKNSPKNAKVIDADFLQMQGFCLVAWVIEKSLSKIQGYQRASVALYQNGQFCEVNDLLPCRYYEENGERKITTAPFGVFSDEKAPELLEKRPDNQACVTLVCGGKPISRMIVWKKTAQKSC